MKNNKKNYLQLHLKLTVVNVEVVVVSYGNRTLLNSSIFRISLCDNRNCIAVFSRRPRNNNHHFRLHETTLNEKTNLLFVVPVN